MKFAEQDWRIGPLYGVILAIDAGLTDIKHRMDENDVLFDVDDARDHVNVLIGLGFVAAQAYIVGTIADLNELRTDKNLKKLSEKDSSGIDRIRLKTGDTKIQLIVAAANYFKHHDQWSRLWTKNKYNAETLRILKLHGITSKTNCPCLAVMDVFTTSWEFVVVHQVVKEWRTYLLATSKKP